MPASNQKIEANRRNAQHSTGPKSPEGKARSRANSLTHGLTGAGVVLDDETRSEIDDEIEMMTELYRPADEVERRLVERAALASARLNRSLVVHEVRLSQRRRHALRDHDERVEAEVRSLAAKLISEPAWAVAKLGRTSAGCARLAEEWSAVAAKATRSQWWTAELLRRTWQLLGSEARPFDPPEPRLTDFHGLTRKDQPADDADREAMRSFARAEAARWGARAEELWREQDEADRALAPILASVDVSPEGNRLRQYESSAERMMSKALEELRRSRAESPPPGRVEAPPAPPGPRSSPSARPPAAAVRAMQTDRDKRLRAMAKVDRIARDHGRENEPNGSARPTAMGAVGGPENHPNDPPGTSG